MPVYGQQQLEQVERLVAHLQRRVVAGTLTLLARCQEVSTAAAQQHYMYSEREPTIAELRWWMLFLKFRKMKQ